MSSDVLQLETFCQRKAHLVALKPQGLLQRNTHAQLWPHSTLGKLRQEVCHRFDTSLQSERSPVITS